MSFASTFLRQLLDVRIYAMGVFYGCDKVRFPGPVPVGSRIRGRAVVTGVTELEDGIDYEVEVTVEVEDRHRPGCVAVLRARRHG